MTDPARDGRTAVVGALNGRHVSFAPQKEVHTGGTTRSRRGRRRGRRPPRRFVLRSALPERSRRTWCLRGARRVRAARTMLGLSRRSRRDAPRPRACRHPTTAAFVRNGAKRRWGRSRAARAKRGDGAAHTPMRDSTEVRIAAECSAARRRNSFALPRTDATQSVSVRFFRLIQTLSQAPSAQVRAQ
jgi:hypothetical protein